MKPRAHLRKPEVLALMGGLRTIAGLPPVAVEDDVMQLATIIAVATAGADPQPFTGSWS